MTEEQARQWVTDLLSLIARISALTPTTIDDRIVQMAFVAVSEDMIWAWVWSILRRVLEGESLLVGDVPPEIQAEAEEVRINPATLIAIVTAIVELIKIFRKTT